MTNKPTNTSINNLNTTFGFKHETELQLRFNDIDMMGHVNNAVYQNYFDYAKVQYFNEVLGSEVDWQKSGLVLAKITLEYLNPIFLEEPILVRSKTTKLGNKSMTLFQEIINAKTLETKATGLSIMVGFNFHTQQAIEIDERWKTLILAYED